jgi:hypothetical protein
MTTTPAMEAGWQPDPTGRHEYRYHDGSSWTDNVSDGGTASTDPMPAAEPAEPEPAPPAPGPAPFARPQATKKSKVPIIAAVAAVLVIIVAFLALRGGGGDNDATTSGEVAIHVESGKVAVRHVKVPQDSVLLVKVIPDGEFDPVLALAADFPTIEKYKTTFGFNAPFGRGAVDTASDAAFTDTDVSAIKGGVFYVVNGDGPGKPEAAALPAPFDASVDIVISGPGGGDVTLQTEIRSFSGPATKPDQGSLYMRLVTIAYSDFVNGTADISETREFTAQSDFTADSDFALLSDEFSALSDLPE